MYIVLGQPHWTSCPTIPQIIFFKNKNFAKLVIEPNKVFGWVPFLLVHVQFSLHPPVILCFLYAGYFWISWLPNHAQFQYVEEKKQKHFLWAEICKTKLFWEKKTVFDKNGYLRIYRFFYCYDQNKMIIIVLWQAFSDRKKKAFIAVEFFCYAEVKREKLVSIFF